MRVIQDLQLLPDNLIFTESFRIPLEETLERCRGFCKASEVLDVNFCTSDVATIGSEIESRAWEKLKIVVCHTFITVMPELGEDCAVTVSTTDVRRQCGVDQNPRAIAAR